jgi:hypothetical protein
MAGGGDGFPCCQSSGFDSCRLTSNPRLRIGRSRVGGEQDGPQPTRRRRRQHMHHAGRCPVPTDSRLFPLDQTKRERHNSLNLNGSEGCVARCPTVPAVFRVAPMARGLRATDAAQAEPGRWCPPGGTVHARVCPILPGHRRDFLGFFAAREGFKSPSSHFVVPEPAAGAQRCRGVAAMKEK